MVNSSNIFVKFLNLLNIGAIFKDLGDLNHAREYFLKSLEIQADDPDALMNIGATYILLGCQEEANIAMLKLLSIKPDHPNALLNTMHCFKADNLPYLRNVTLKTVTQNKGMLDNLETVEAISCLGEKFFSEVLQLNI